MLSWAKNADPSDVDELTGIDRILEIISEQHQAQAVSG